MNAEMRGSPDHVAPGIELGPEAKLEQRIRELDGCSTEFELGRWVSRWGDRRAQILARILGETCGAPS